MKIVLLEFNDSMFVQGAWHSKEDSHHTLNTRCVAIGVLCETTEKDYVLYPYLCETEVARGIIIPKSSVTRMRELKVITNQQNKGDCFEEAPDKEGRRW